MIRSPIEQRTRQLVQVIFAGETDGTMHLVRDRGCLPYRLVGAQLCRCDLEQSLFSIAPRFIERCRRSSTSDIHRRRFDCENGEHLLHGLKLAQRLSEFLAVFT